MQEIIRDKKRGILYRYWHGPSSKANCLLVHGLGTHSGRWEYLSGFLLKNRISSCAIELKGFGETKTPKGHITSYGTYFRDIESLCGVISRKNPGKKVFLLGESIGGLITYLMSTSRPDLFDGLICISPAFGSRLKFSFFDYLKMVLALLCNPKKPFRMPFDSRMATRDENYYNAMDENNHEHRFATPMFLLISLLAQKRAKMLKHSFQKPVLFLLAGNDKLVRTEDSMKVFNSLGSEDKTLIRYPDMYHALTLDLEKEKVFVDIMGWINKKIGEE